MNKHGQKVQHFPPTKHSPMHNVAAVNANDLRLVGHRSPPAELNVVRLVGEGLPNKDIAERLFVSPRTVQAHLSHVYSKLGVSSRVQLAQEATRHA